MTTADPRVDSSIELADGRSLAYARWGDPDGTPVVLLHGTPGSRLICPDEDATTAGAVSLLTIDRPGYGRSDPCPDQTLLGFASDFAALAESLDLPSCPVVGWSGGGPYALACAVTSPERTTAIGLVSSTGHVDGMPGDQRGLPPEVSRLIRDFRQRDPGAADRIHQRARLFTDNPLAILEMTIENDDDPDRPLMLNPTVAAALATMWTEGARQGAAGYVTGWKATWGLPWGFSPGDVSTGVHIWHGLDDLVVPVAHARHLASAMPQAQLVTYPGEGHLVGITHWAEILAALVPVSPAARARP